MGNATSILSHLGLSDLWKYVFNAMECRSNCCEGAFVCDCITKEVEVESDSEGCLDCLGCEERDYTSESVEE